MAEESAITYDSPEVWPAVLSGGNSSLFILVPRLLR